MNKKNIPVIVGIIASSVMLSGCPVGSATSVLNQVATPVNPISSVATATATGSSEAVTYKNTKRNFSFIIPKGWKKQQGDSNSEGVLFMKVPISTSCSFQFHINRMRPSFPAESSVKISLKTAKEDITIDKLISAKRRDESGKEKGKTVKFTRGWEVVEKAKSGNIQRIIYQAYDRENYYFNMMAAASTPEKFKKCEPELRQIIDSIKFGD